MREVITLIETTEPEISRSQLRQALHGLLVKEGIIKAHEPFPEHSGVVLEKFGMQEDGVFRAKATISVPEPEDKIKDFLSLLGDVNIEDDTPDL